MSQKKQRAKKRAKKLKSTRWVRPYVFARERDICRFCWREAQSRHELVPLSRLGPISPENCVAVCGSGTTGCHGFAQRNELSVVATLPARGAEDRLHVTVCSKAAAKWLKMKIGELFESGPRYRREIRYIP